MQEVQRIDSNRILGIWLLCCAASVFIMVVVGGFTRLTQSGLSMVEWDPIMGIIPPLGEAAWMEVFNKYRQSPEYLLINRGMSLDDFKFIFYWEYGHRVLGRLIGMIYLLPLLVFVYKGWVPRAWYGRFFFLFLLGGAQGLMGWYMVMSGLVDVPHVSQYRLTAHLGLAFIIFSAMLWFALDFMRGEHHHNRSDSAYLNISLLTLAIVFLMVLSGGFVAGTKAGFIINTFPTMNGQWIPDGLVSISPAWKNLFENPVTIQFVHRSLAIIVTLSVLLTFIISRRQGYKTHSELLLIALSLQVSLGVITLVNKVPVVLGAAHQGGAVILLATALLVAHTARKGASRETKTPQVSGQHRAAVA